MEKSKSTTQTRDTLANDLLEMLAIRWGSERFGFNRKNVGETFWQIPPDVKDQLMQKLTIYITRRDHSVWNDGYQKGKNDSLNS